MQSILLKLVSAFLFILLLSACTAAPAAPAGDLIWRISVSNVEVTDNLESAEAVTQYNGSKTDVKHEQTPSSGSVYLIVHTTVTKANPNPVAFSWKQLSVRDESGAIHPRHSNDSFLEQYGYTPRITGLEIRLGDNDGWLCFEIPASAAKGKLTLIYSAEGSQQEIPLHP